MKNRASLASVAVALLLSACATPRLDGIHPGESITVEIEPDRYGRGAAIGIVNANVGTGAKAGMSTGAIVGIIGAASCGPWFLLCASVFGAAGMGSGALLGTVAGAAAGLPSGTESELMERARRRDAAMRSDLVAAIRERLATRWSIALDSAPTRLNVHLDRASFVLDGDHYMALAIRATVTVERQGRDPRDRPARRTYEYKGLPAHPSAWMQQDGAPIDEALRRAYAHIAEAVFLELAH